MGVAFGTFKGHAFAWILIAAAVVIGAGVGAAFLWPAGEHLQQFPCIPNQMGESPVCHSYFHTNIFGSSLGKHVSTLGGWSGVAIGTIIGVVLAVAALSVTRRLHRAT